MNRLDNSELDGEQDAYLTRLGDQVRSWRARRGMSRKILSHDSGVSERYLAQLETGKGNISILLLRQIASAMNIPLVELLDEGPELSADARLLMEQLRRLSAEDLTRAREILGEAFPLALQGKKHLALIGLRGAGKTTIGRALADSLQLPFRQIGEEIEQNAGMDMGEIFSLLGQSAYRRMERQALDNLLQYEGPSVIEAGGGIVSELSTFARLLSGTFTIWVRTSPEQHMQRVVAQGDQRPMQDNPESMEDLRRILEDREPLYAKADMVVDSSHTNIQSCIDVIRKAYLETTDFL